jgi:putative sterol carrier protein
MGLAHELGSAAMSAEDFFKELPNRVDPGKTAGMNNSYVFAIEGAGTWTVRVADGAVTVDEGDTGGDCRISASAETFERIVAGEQNPTAAYMSGKLKVKGDIGAAMKLQKLF